MLLTRSLDFFLRYLWCHLLGLVSYLISHDGVLLSCSQHPESPIVATEILCQPRSWGRIKLQNSHNASEIEGKYRRICREVSQPWATYCHAPMASLPVTSSRTCRARVTSTQWSMFQSTSQVHASVTQMLCRRGDRCSRHDTYLGGESRIQ